MQTRGHTLLNPLHRRTSPPAAMAKRKTKKPQPEDASVLLDEPVVKPKRRTSFSVSPALLCVITLAVGASIMGWFCVQQQHSIDHLSESFTTMQQRVINFQSAMDRQPDELADLSVEERISALEESQKQAQQKAEAALATSEKVKNSDLFSQIGALQTEMNTQWDEMKQATLSIATLRGVFKNTSEDLEIMKERVASALSSSATLSDTVNGLATSCLRVVEQAASVDALNAQVEAHASELNDLKDLLYLHSVALQAHNREMVKMKEIVEARQLMRAQALEEMLSLVRASLDEQFFTSQNLHSSVLAQLQTFQSQLADGPSWPIKHKADEEDLKSLTSHSEADQEAPEDVQDQTGQDNIEDDEVEDVMEEDQLTQPEVDADVAEEEERMEEDISEQDEEQEDIEEEAEDTITGDVLDESFEEEAPEEAVEDSESIEDKEEESELNMQPSEELNDDNQL